MSLTSTQESGDSPLKSVPHQASQTEFRRLLAPSLLVAFAAMAGFSLIAVVLVSHAGVAERDLQFARWLHVHRSSGLIETMRFVSALNGIAGIGLMTVALALWLRRNGPRTWLEALVLTVPGVMVLNALLKQIFARPRPHFADPWTSLTSYSFPSGHVSQSTVFYGFLAAWLVMHTCHRALRTMIVAAASLMILVVATSRLYLGAHYLTDVVAAFFEGVAWLAICCSAMAWRQHRNEFSGIRR